MSERLESRNAARNEHLGVEPVDGHQLIRDVVAARQAKIRATRLRVSLELNARERGVVGDRAEIGARVGALVDAAIAHSTTADTISVRTSVVEGALVVEVARGEHVDRAQLPTRRTVQANGAQPASAPGAKQLLVVDDDPDTLTLLERALARRGYAVTTAMSVQAALDAAAARDFDAVLADMRLPDGSGADLVARLVAARRGPVRAIALTGNDLVAGEDGARFAAHLTKPVSITTLDETLQRLLADGQQRTA